jgi:branched-chain amino acid transport system permease protein
VSGGRRIAAAGAACLALLALPLVATSYETHILILIAFYGVLALAWNVLGGMAGQISLGHSLFIGIGAYASSLLYLRLGLSPWFGIVLGALLGAAAGTVLGWVVFNRRLTGIYFALVTLAFAEMAYYLASNLDALGASNGLDIPPTSSPAAFQFASKAGYCYVAFALLAIAVLVSLAISRSRLGYLLSAVRQNERAAAALGVNVVALKLMAAAISGALAAAAGTFYAQYVLFIDPDSVLGISFSVEALTYAFVGGIGTTLGPLLGAVILVPVTEALRAGLGGRFTGASLVVYGIILIAVVRLAPDGLAGALAQRLRRGRRA